MKPRNILFITADQWRAECLSTLNHPVVKTPNLDALAREGTLFARHFSNTSPCSPSRATLHTGLYQHNHRVTMNGTPLDRRHTNWALEARKLGYDPALIGYTDQTVDPRDAAPGDPRLSTYEGILPGLTDFAATSMDFPGPWAKFLRARGYELPAEERHIIWSRETGADYEDGAQHPKPWVVKAEHNDTTWHVDQAIDYIATNRNEPWILHLSLLRPHPPWIASEPWNRLYDPEALPPPTCRDTRDAEAGQHPWLAYQLKHPVYQSPDDIRKLNRMRAIYFAMMSEVDENLGRLFEHLKHERRWDDTLIVFTSDHGEQLGDHRLLGKASYFDATYAVPLIVCDPRASADRTRGTQIRSFTEHVDIMPTLLEAIGADVPPQCDGRSLMSLVEGQTPPWRTEAHFEFDFRDASFEGVEQALGLTLHQCNFSVVRGERFKYVHFANLPPLLFDLERDPHEFTNLANAADYTKVALACAQKLVSWRLAHEDQTLTHMMATGKGMIARPARRL